MNSRFWLLVVLLVAIGFVNLVTSSVYLSGNQDVAVPADNGTSSNTNISARMQQYVGFFGEINATIILGFANNNTRIYQKPVTSGKIFFVKVGAALTGAIQAADADTDTDANFSLTGYYITANHFTLSSTVAGVASVNHLNTTDNFMVGIFKDSAAAPNYFVGTDIRSITSANGMGDVSYEVIVPKTGTYTAYDVFIDLE
ncbi:MAG: hypothetical protein ABIG96_06550 [Candidatus Micrarchaeota archaeon]